MSETVLCVDVGSTFTKAALVDVDEGTALAVAAHPTTLGGDVLDGVAAVRAAVEAEAGVRAGEVLACSSAGGGLRIAVVGYERLVTSEAGHRVALTAGGRVVHVHSGELSAAGIAALRAARPDVVLLVGGTDGGNADVVLHNARRLAAARVAVPVVYAGNAEVAAEAEALFAATGRRVTFAPNVLPRIGVLEPAGARAAVREAFLAHVIGGKGLSRGRAFARLVRAATPDAVLDGVAALADHGAAAGTDVRGDLLVVDVGGATTDVYSVVTPSGQDAELRRDVVGRLPRARTVEGDLGMRWSAPDVVAAARAEKLLPDRGEEAALARYAERVVGEPGRIPGDGEERARDARLAELAVTVALRRHARPPVPSAGPRPLREVGLVIGSGGVLRHGDAALRRRVLAPAVSDHAGAWPVPEGARLAVDERYLLFAAGLLAARAPVVAARLAASGLAPVPAAPGAR